MLNYLIIGHERAKLSERPDTCVRLYSKNVQTFSAQQLFHTTQL